MASHALDRSQKHSGKITGTTKRTQHADQCMVIRWDTQDPAAQLADLIHCTPKYQTS